MAFVGCVNRNDENFKKLAKDCNISEGKLELIIHNYWSTMGKEDGSFPSVDYIRSQINNGKNEVSRDILDKALSVWNSKYSTPKSFATYEAASKYMNSITEFPASAITMNRVGGMYEVRVAQPVMNSKDAIAAEKESIKRLAIANGTFMKAPNGKDTNLNEDQWLTVRTKAFKDWFGDWINEPENASKVVDENGEPLVVYHGTDDYGFDVFKPEKSDDKISLFATSSKFIASTYSKHKALHSKVLFDTLNSKESLNAINNNDLKTLVSIINSIEDDMSEYARDEAIKATIEYMAYPNMSDEDTRLLDIELDKIKNETKFHRFYAKVYRDRIVISDYNIPSETPLFEGTIDELKNSLSNESTTYNLFYNLKNPLIIDNQENEFGAAPNWNELFDEHISNKQLKTRNIAKYAKDNGYDGVIFKNIIDHGKYFGDNTLNPWTAEDEVYAYFNEGTDSYTGDNVFASNVYIAFNSNQIKSATENSGEFSREDNNIYHESRPVEFRASNDNTLINFYNSLENRNEAISASKLFSVIRDTDLTAIYKLLNDFKPAEGSLLDNYKVRLVNEVSNNLPIVKGFNGRRAYYNADNKTIYIKVNSVFNEGNSSDVILHEIMHAITVDHIVNNPKAVNAFNDIINSYEKQFKKEYGRKTYKYLESDPHRVAEFIADVWTDESLIKDLKKFKSNNKTILQRIVDFFSNIIKGIFSNVENDSLFTEASNEIYKLLSTASTGKATGQYYENLMSERQQISNEDSQFITEKIFVSENGHNKDITSLVKSIESANVDDNFLSSKIITIPYKEWKSLKLVNDKKWVPLLNFFESNWGDYHNTLNPKYNASTKSISTIEGFYNFVKFISDNYDVLNEAYTNSDSKDDFEAYVWDAIENNNVESILSDLNAQYLYEDSRQGDLFNQPQSETNTPKTTVDSPKPSNITPENKRFAEISKRRNDSLGELDKQFNSTEILDLANQVVWAMSDFITRAMEDPENNLYKLDRFANLKRFSENPEENNAVIASMSRAEFVEYLTVNALCDEIKDDLFNASSERYADADFEICDKANILYDNFDALLLMASNTFAIMEEFSINPETTISENEYSVDKNVNLEDVDNTLSMDEETLLEIAGNRQQAWQLSSLTRDVWSTASQLVKRRLQRLKEKDPAGNDILTDYGVSRRINIGKAMAILTNTLNTCLTLQEMVDKLKGLEESNPWLTELIQELDYKGEDRGRFTELQNEFFTSFANHKNTYSITQKQGDKLVSKVVNEHPALDEAMKNIDATIKAGASILFGDKGVTREKWDDLNKAFAYLNKFSNVKFEEIGDSFSRICAGLEYVSKLFGYYDIKAEDIMTTLTEKDYKTMMVKLSSIVSNLYKVIGRQDYNPMSHQDSNGIRSYLKAFLSPLTKTKELVTVSSTSDNGKMYQTYTQPSYLSKMFIKFQTYDDFKFEEFLNSEYGSSEWFATRDASGEVEWRTPWLATLATMTQKDRANMFKHKIELNFNKHNYMRDLTAEDYAVSMFTNYWGANSSDSNTSIPLAWYRIPIMSNKPVSEFIQFVRYDGATYKAQITEGFMNIFEQELSRIQTVKERKKLYTKDSPEWIKNFDNNGDKFSMLTWFNDATGELKELIDKKTSGDELTSEENTRLSQLASDNISSYIDSRAAEVVNKWQKSGVAKAMEAVEGFQKSGLTIEEAITNFVWNDAFAAANIMELTITDPAFYKNTEDLQKRLAQLHAPGRRANVKAVDYNGREVTDGIHRAIVLADFDNIISNTIDNLSEVFDKLIDNAENEVEKETYTALKDSVLDAYKNINVADAQAFSCLTSYRKKGYMFGKWSREAEELYKRLNPQAREEEIQRIAEKYKDNEKLAKSAIEKLRAEKPSTSDIKAALQPLKPFNYSTINMPSGVSETSTISNFRVPIQFKDAEYLLIIADALLDGKSTSKPNLLRVISEVMEESAAINPTKGIDTVMFESAVKSGLHGKLNSMNKYTTKDENGKEVKHSEEWTEEAFRTYLESQIYLDGNKTAYNTSIVYESSFEDYCIQQDVPEHFNGHSQNHGSQARYITVADLPAGIDITFKDGTEERTLSAEQFRDEYEKNISLNIEESLDILRSELCLGDDYSYADKNIAISRILQKEIRENPRYGTDLLRACMVDEKGNFNLPLGDPIQSKRIEQLLNSIIKNRVISQKIAGGPVVQVSNFGFSKKLNIVYNEDGSIKYYEAYAPIYSDELKKFMDKDGVINVEDIERVDPDLLKMVGYRIPTEAKYSMIPIKIVGFVPREAGDAIILPYEITTQTGSDFDVDKLYLMRKSLYIQERQFENNKALIEEIKKNWASEIRLRDLPLSDKQKNMIKLKAEQKADELESKIKADKQKAIDRAKRKKEHRDNGYIEKYNINADALEKSLNDGTISEEEYNSRMDKLDSRYDKDLQNSEDLYNADVEAVGGENLTDAEKQQIKDVYNKSIASDIASQKSINLDNIIKLFLENPNRPSGSSPIMDAIKTAYIKSKYSVVYPTSGKEYRDNKIVDMTYAVLTHPAITPEVVNPGGFDTQKRIGYAISAIKNGSSLSYDELVNMSDIDSIKSESYKSSNLLFIDTQQEFYRQNSVAGTILGMFAVQRIAHASMQGLGLYLDTQNCYGLRIGDFEFYKKMDLYVDKDSQGNPVYKTLGSLVASAADAVKDPVLNLMNINSTTAPVLTSLLHMGCSFEDAALFLSQQTLIDLMNEVSSSNTQGEFISLSKAIDDKISKLEDAIEADETLKNSPDVKLHKGALIRGLTNSGDLKLQLAVLNAYKVLSENAAAMKGLTLISRYNSTGAVPGPLIIDCLMDEYKEADFSTRIHSHFVAEDTGRGKKLENIERVKNFIFDQRPILASFRDAKMTYRELMGSMPLNSNQFRHLVNVGLFDSERMLMGESNTGTFKKNFTDALMNNRDLLNKFSNFYLSMLLLSSGCVKETVGKDKSACEYYINSFPKYFIKSDFYKKYPNNPFIQAIKMESDKGLPVLNININGMDMEYKERLTAGWSDLYKEDPKLAVNLFNYAFWRGGIGFTPKTFMGLLPLNMKMGMEHYMDSFIGSFDIDENNLIRQFGLHNSKEHSLVKSCKKDEITINGNFVTVAEKYRNVPYLRYGDIIYRNITKEDDKTVSFEKVGNTLGGENQYMNLSVFGRTKDFALAEKFNVSTEETQYTGEELAPKATEDIVVTDESAYYDNSISTMEANAEHFLTWLRQNVTDFDRAVNVYKETPEGMQRIKNFLRKQYKELYKKELSEELLDTTINKFCK